MAMLTGLRQRMPKTTMEKEEQLAAWSAQALGLAISASLSRDAGAGTGHQQQAVQQEPLGLSVHIEFCQSTTWLWGHKKQGPFVREVILSFKRRPPEDLNRSFPAKSAGRRGLLWKVTLAQQQDDLQDRELQQSESQGQCFSLRCCGGLNDTPGQMILEPLGAQSPIIEPVALAREQECEDAIHAELSEEEEWADAIYTELSEEEAWEDAIDTELVEEEEWQDAIDTELSQGTDAVASPPASLVHYGVSSLGLEENTGPREGPSCCSSVGREAAGEAADKLLRASPAPVHPADAQLADSALLVALEEEEHHTPFKHEEAEPPASSALVEAARAAGAENQTPAPHGPTAHGLTQLDAAQTMGAEGVDKTVLVQGLDKPPREMWGQEQSKDKVTGATAITGAENLEAGLHNPTTDALLLLDSADYIRTETVKRAWLMIQEPVHQPEEEWQQERSMDDVTAATARAEGLESPADALHSPTVDTPPLLDMADYTRTEVVKKAWLMVQEPVQEPEEKWEQKGSRDKVTTATARASGAESPAHAQHSPTVDNPALLDMDNCIRTEIVEKAHCVVPSKRPFQEVKEQQDQKKSPVEAIASPAGYGYSLLTSTVLNTSARERLLSRDLSLWVRRESEAGTYRQCHRSAGHSSGDQK
ncbi:uncharacterized protein LOC130265241 [Oenanthe melanoleuca]|uniref:uncharacterized protein LOC130265241 n=1 Tax=Oenanthe melanoleuca TaxID=2939378 RepID=UPI0024C19691|nr:uncharacterized protein LOC130265241 [Oenanthe melanoleuca]